MTDLDMLIEAVEADEEDVTCQDFCDGLGDDMHYKWRPAYKAYHGSLDAALALHEVLLPGWRWGHNESSPGVHRVYVCQRSALLPTPTRCEASTPARAWLIAILKAYRSIQNDAAHPA